jgi:tetratricopeptide (TPR) repeat protein
LRIRRTRYQPFYSSRRRGPSTFRLVFNFSLFIGAFLFIVYTQFDRLQLAALNAVGMSPTATPFASTIASQAAQLYANGDVNGAVSLYKRAVDQQPDNISYVYEYGKLLNDLDDSDPFEVAALGDRIIALAPNDPRGYALKATALMWTEPTTAIPVAVLGLETDPNFAPLYSALSIAYTNIGRYQEGLIQGEQAVLKNPMDAAVHRAYAWPLIYVGRYEQAIGELEEAIAINPNLASTYFELASLYRRIDQPAMAVAIFQHILEMQPNNIKAYLRMCETYTAVGEFQQGQPFCEQATDICETIQNSDPICASAYRGLGQVQYPRRNYEGSIESFQKCVALGSDEIECWYLRGLAHYYLNDCELAWEVLQESLVRAETQGEPEGIIENINTGLYNITQRCAGYAGRPLPTPIPPTTIPPTPIGGGN